MKQRIFLFFSLIVISLTSFAYDFVVDGKAYNVVSMEKRTCEITYDSDFADSYVGDFLIPSNVAYNGVTFTVSEFNSEKFRLATSIETYSVEEDNQFFSVYESVLYDKDKKSLISFPHGSHLESFIIPEFVSEIKKYSIFGASSIKSIFIPDGIAELPVGAFCNCTSLISIHLPSYIKELPASCFSNCSSLISISIPNSCTLIDANCFQGCSSLTDISMGDNIFAYGGGAFQDCISLVSIKLSDSAISIPEYMFSNCASLQTVEYGDHVTNIGEFAFSNCSSLENFHIGKNISLIGYRSFSLCSKLQKVTFGPNVTTIHQYAFDSIDDVVFEDGDKDISFTTVPGTKGPDAMLTFGASRFYLGRNVFIAHPSSSSVSNSKLKYLGIGNGVQRDCLYYKFENLEELYIGGCDVSIPWHLSEKLTTITVSSQIPPEVSSFSNKTYLNATLKVPKGCKSKYQTADVWKNFLNIEEIRFPLTGIEINPQYLHLPIGRKTTLSLKYTPSFATPITYKFSSSNPQVVSVDNFGNIECLKEGQAIITIECDDNPELIGQCVIDVYQKVESLTLNIRSCTLSVGQNTQLSALILPENAENKSVKWSASNKTVVSVSNDGLIEALSPGSTNVYCVSIENNEIMDYCKVTVEPSIIQVESITINRNQFISGYINDTFTPDVKILPIDATDKNLLWTVEDSSIASVDANGTITLLSVGYTKVRATSSNGVFGECEIIVNPKMPQTFAITPENISLNVGETFTFQAVLTPEDIDNRSITWSSDDLDKVSIDNDGTVRAIVPNCLVYIHGTTANGLQASASVSVNPIQAEEITLSSDNITIHCLADGGISYTDILTATITPDNTTDKTLTWTSSDESIARYDEFFESHIAVGNPGTAILTAKTANGISASCTVNVIQDVTNIALPQYYYTVNIGESVQIIYTVSPSNATNPNLEWTSSNNEIATVSSTGEVFGHKEGVVTIKATSINDIYNECQVTVRPILSELISLDYDSKEITVGETFTLVATILPDNTTDKAIEWVSSDLNVATVSNNGVVTGIGLGDCIISAYNGTNYASCSIKVTDGAGINEITTDSESISIVSQNGSILIFGANDDAITYIYDTAGNLLYFGLRREIPINMNGVYIVVIENMHSKVVVK